MMIKYTKLYIKLCIRFISKLKQKIELIQYDDFTISEYLRKQGAQIGDNNRIMIRNLGAEACLIKIGNHCTITAGVSLIVHDGAGWIFTNEIPSLQRFGAIEIKDNCFIGIGATILPNVKIGPNSIVGARSVVKKNVLPGTVVAGNPARQICTIDEYRKKIIKEWEIQKPAGYLSELHGGTIYSPSFIESKKRKGHYALLKYLSKQIWESKIK